MSLEFYIPQPQKKVNAKTLAKGFGLPLVKRALLNLPEFEEGDTPEGMSLFGTPVFDNVFIQKPNYSVYQYDEFLKTYTNTPIVLPDNGTGQVSDAEGNNSTTDGLTIQGCMIDVVQNKNIIVTDVSGADGTVKEYINNGDYNITIRGFFAHKNPEKYPKVDVQTLHTYCAAPVSLKISSKFLNDIFGVTNIVVIRYNLFQQVGMRNVQYFEIEALSDIDFQIQENKG